MELTVSKNFVLGTIHKYDWVRRFVIKHPEEGKVVDMNESVRKDTGVEDRKFKDISDKWLWKSRVT